MIAVMPLWTGNSLPPGVSLRRSPRSDRELYYVDVLGTCIGGVVDVSVPDVTEEWRVVAPTQSPVTPYVSREAAVWALYREHRGTS